MRVKVEAHVFRKLLFLTGIRAKELFTELSLRHTTSSRWKQEGLTHKSWKRLMADPFIADLVHKRKIVEVHGGKDGRQLVDIVNERIFVDLQLVNEATYRLRVLDISVDGCPYIQQMDIPRFSNLELAVFAQDWKSVLKP